MPRATEGQLLGMIRANRALSWITAASGWKKDEVLAFADRHHFEWIDEHPRPVDIEKGGASTPVEGDRLTVLLAQAERSPLASTRKLAVRAHKVLSDLTRRVEAEIQSAAEATAAAKEREAAAAEVKRLETELAAAREKARGSRPGRSQAPAQDGGSDMAEIRAWGRQNGYTVGDKGVVRAEVRQAYAQAHQGH